MRRRFASVTTVMCNEKTLLTETGYLALEKELNDLLENKRPRIKKRVKRARRFCDFYEDAEYESALVEQNKINARIKHLQYTLNHAKIVPKGSTNNSGVAIGSVVTVLDKNMDVKETYTLVTKEEADVINGKISIDSPLGKSLFNKQINEQFSVETPNGMVKFKVINIE